MAHRLTNRRRKELASLGRKKNRDQLSQMLVEGLRSVASAVAAGAPIVELIVSKAAHDDARVQAILERADGPPVYAVPERTLAQLSDVQTPQGLLAVVRTDTIATDQLPAQQTVLALDGVQDPGNVGTALRTAAWFGAEAVLAGAGTAGFFNPKVVRATAGGLWDVHLAQTKDLASTLQTLQEHGFASYGADLNGTPVRQWTAQTPSVLVLGSEAHGISPEVQALLAERIVIDGAARRRGVESLNVAVAAGILMHAWLGS